MVSERPIRIASRGSQLALWQANAIRDALLALAPEVPVEIEVVRTTGDRVTDVPLASIGDRGLFTKEIDATLLEGRADVAVHSLKDVPTRYPDGLVLAAVGRRADPRDVLIGPAGGETSLDSLPAGSRVGTSSLRRRSQLLALRPDLEVVDLRGNLNTRLARLDAGDYDAIVLAAAGVVRLGWTERISEWLPVDRWLPAVGQGALAVMARADDPPLVETLAALHHAETACSVAAERTLLRELEGGCQIPIGALARVEQGELVLDAVVGSLDGTRMVRGTRRGAPSDAEAIGSGLAAELMEAGAAGILEEIRRGAGAAPIPAP